MASSSSLLSCMAAMPVNLCRPCYRHLHRRHLVLPLFLSFFFLVTLGPSTSTIVDARPLPPQQQVQHRPQQLKQQSSSISIKTRALQNQKSTTTALKQQQLQQPPPPVVVAKYLSSSVKSGTTQVHIPHDHPTDNGHDHDYSSTGCSYPPCQQHQPCTATSPCTIPPSTSCTHCGCTGYQPCATAPSTTCTHCGCPGYNACTTAPPTCLHCGCPGYQACPTSAPTVCTHCGCPGYKECTPTVPPCTTTVTCTSTTGCHQPTGGCTQTVPPTTTTTTPCNGHPCTTANPQNPTDGNSGGTTTTTTESGTENAGNGGGTSPIQTRSECFHGSSSYVTLLDGRQTRISNIKVGDYVQTSANGHFSRVFMFTHRDATITSDFIRLSLSNNTHVLLTSGHLVEVWRTSQKDRRRQRMVVDAGEIKVDIDWVMSTTGLRRVTEKRWVRSHGIYNPQTLDGRIIVNGVVMTTYTRATGTDRTGTGHSLLAPLRAMYRIGGLDVSGLFCVR